MSVAGGSRSIPALDCFALFVEEMFHRMAILKKFLIALFGVAAFLTYSSCIRDSYYVKITGPVTLNESWIESQPQPPLKVDKDLQMILLDLESPFKYDFDQEGREPNKGAGILMPDGEVINPEIEVIDQYGNRFNLVLSGARETFKPVYNLPYPDKWPRDREYKIVRIRSPRPIKCNAIYWFCESAKDTK
jgi:hypothetical protein